jgi:hypothetical protein
MREIDLQQQVADYIRLQYPTVIFHSDFGSGIKLTMGQAIKQKRLNGGRRSWPDMFIAGTIINKIRNNDGSYNAYSGLFVELKKEGTRIFKKDGTLVSDAHIREQYDMLHDLRARGYAAEFACGFDEAKKLIDDYMKGRYAHVD